MANTDKFSVDCVQFWFFVLIFVPQFHAIGRQKARLEARKTGYPGRKQMKINMADQGNRKEVYYFARGFRCKVLQEYIYFYKVSEKQDLKTQWI